MFGGTRRFLALVILCTLTTGCTGSTPDPPRAEPPPTVADTTTTTPTTTTTTEPEPDTGQFDALLADPALTTEQQVEAAYLHHWKVLLAAFADGRPELLDLVYTGDALSTRTAEIDRLAANGHQVRGGITHNYGITILSEDFALVIDAMTNELERVDRSTGEVLDPATAELNLLEFQLRKVGDQWLVDHVVGLTSD